MGLHEIKRGLRLPITGEPTPDVETGRVPRRVALLGADYVGMKPTMHTSVGSEVRRGELLFEDKKIPGVRFTAPGAGRVVAIHRGAKRAFQSLVIELSRAELEGRTGSADETSFGTFRGDAPGRGTEQATKDLLLESGLWTALRARPFERVADPARRPRSIFVTAIETDPLAADARLVLAGDGARFRDGLAVLGALTEGPVFVCTGPDTEVELPPGDRFRHERFRGPHPAGTVGLHIHRLDPVNREKTVWHVGYQDVIAIGELFANGRLEVGRVVSLAGPSVERPRLLKTRIGAALDDLVEGELVEGESRVVSGSVLSGRTAMGEVLGYLGRYHRQVSVLAEGREREFFGWLVPGLSKFSVKPSFLSKLVPGRRFAFTTTTNGSRRAVVPIEMYEKVTAFDIIPTPLLRSLLMVDVEVAERMGCLELAEEDVALYTFVDPGKNDYGPLLREVLTTIEKEG